MNAEGIAELDEQESDWVFWPPPGEFLPAEAWARCRCGHADLGPDWHSSNCPTVLDAWQWRAKRLHDEVWELLAEVKALDHALTARAAPHVEDIISGLRLLIADPDTRGAVLTALGLEES